MIGIKVPKNEIKFSWNHKHEKGKSSICELKYSGGVIARGNYEQMTELFDELVTNNPKDEVIVTALD